MPYTQGFSALAVLLTSSFLVSLFTLSHAQPLPNCVAPAAENWALNSSKLPKSRSMAAARSPVGFPPAFGAMLSQKNVWLRTWAALLKVGVGDPLFHDLFIIPTTSMLSMSVSLI